MPSDVFEAFRAMDIPEEKALKAASPLPRRDDDVIGIKSDLSAIRADIVIMKADIVGLKADVHVLKTEGQIAKWMLGAVLAFVITIAIKLFIH
jgi:hypothetical protein